MSQGNQLLHSDRSDTVTLVIEKKRMPDNTFAYVRSEWNAKALREDIGHLFKKVPMFNVTREEFDSSCRVIDKYIMDNCSKAELEEYEKEDKIPAKLLFEVPEMLKPFWNVLISVNQNKRSSYRVLDGQIPGFPDIDVNLWSGYKVLGPFNSEMNTYYNVVRVTGAPNDIDRFIRKYRK